MICTPSVLRYFWKADVTVCIPAYEAANFIDRTLRCAQGQTYGRLRILVAVDKSKDETATICRRFRKEDPRIEVVQHQERLGWCGNVNSLLERAETRFFFLYFHDDLILPQYCEDLRRALLRRSDAASAHCDVVEFGMSDAFRRGRTYEGSVAERLLMHWVAQQRGALLRSMVRREMITPDFRLPPEDENGFTPGHPLQMRMVAAGSAIRVPKTLYLRWIRKGGVTDRWKELSYEEMLRGRQKDLAQTFVVIDQLIGEPENRQALKFATALYALRKLGRMCRNEGRSPPRMTDLHPDAPDLELPKDIERFGPEITRRLGAALAKLTPEAKQVA